MSIRLTVSEDELDLILLGLAALQYNNDRYGEIDGVDYAPRDLLTRLANGRELRKDNDPR